MSLDKKKGKVKVSSYACCRNGVSFVDNNSFRLHVHILIAFLKFVHQVPMSSCPSIGKNSCFGQDEIAVTCGSKLNSVFKLFTQPCNTTFFPLQYFINITDETRNIYQVIIPFCPDASVWIN